MSSRRNLQREGRRLNLFAVTGDKVGVVEFSFAPKPTRGFWQALQDLQIDRAYVVVPVLRRYALVEVVPLAELTTLLGLSRACGLFRDD